MVAKVCSGTTKAVERGCRKRLNNQFRHLLMVLSPRFSRSKAHCIAGLTWLQAVLACCALVLQMVMPAAAQSASAGEWMVICGQDGPVLTQVFLTDDTPVPCPDCGDCTACQLLCGADDLPPNGAGLVAMISAQTGPVQFAAILAVNPAQFWYENRGPPLYQGLHRVSAFRAPHAATPSKGAAPWT